MPFPAMILLLVLVSPNLCPFVLDGCKFKVSFNSQLIDIVVTLNLVANEKLPLLSILF